MRPKQMKYTMFLLKLWKPCFHLHLYYCINQLVQNWSLSKSPLIFGFGGTFKRYSQDKKTRKKHIQMPCSVHMQNITFSVNQLFILLKTVFVFLNSEQIKTVNYINARKPLFSLNLSFGNTAYQANSKTWKVVFKQTDFQIDLLSFFLFFHFSLV